MSDINCPYCNKEQDIDHDDGYGYEEDHLYEQECTNVKCQKRFTYTTSISFYHETYKADCLNGSACNYKPSRTHPKEWTMMICTMCDCDRNLTDEEWVLFNKYGREMKPEMA